MTHFMVVLCVRPYVLYTFVTLPRLRWERLRDNRDVDKNYYHLAESVRGELA